MELGGSNKHISVGGGVLSPQPSGGLKGSAANSAQADAYLSELLGYSLDRLRKVGSLVMVEVLVCD